MSELKACPFCGDSGIENSSLYEGHVFCTNCGADMHVDIWQSRPIEDGLRAELARRDEIIARLKEDAERLASNYVIEAFPHEWVCRGGCHHWARFGEQIDHAPDCPITLHRALMKELE